MNEELQSYALEKSPTGRLIGDFAAEQKPASRSFSNAQKFAQPLRRVAYFPRENRSCIAAAKSRSRRRPCDMGEPPTWKGGWSRGSAHHRYFLDRRARARFAETAAKFLMSQRLAVLGIIRVFTLPSAVSRSLGAMEQTRISGPKGIPG